MFPLPTRFLPSATLSCIILLTSYNVQYSDVLNPIWLSIPCWHEPMLFANFISNLLIVNKKCNCYLWFIFIFILWSSIGISHIAFSSSNLTCVLIFYSWRLFELFKGEKKSRGKQIEVHWRHRHKFWSITPHVEGWCVAKPLIVLHNAFLLHINWYLLDFCFAQNSLSLPWYSWTYMYQTTNLVQSPRHWFFDVGHFSESWGPLNPLCWNNIEPSLCLFKC